MTTKTEKANNNAKMKQDSKHNRAERQINKQTNKQEKRHGKHKQHSTMFLILILFY